MDGPTTTEFCHQHLRWHQRACTYFEEQIFPQGSGFRWLRNPLSESVSSLRCQLVPFFRRWRRRWYPFDVAVCFERGELAVDLLMGGMPEIANCTVEAFGQSISTDRSTQ